MSTQKVTLVDEDGNIAPSRNIEILNGNIAGIDMVAIIGHDEALSTTRLTVSPAESAVNVDQSVIHSVPSVVTVSSSSTDDVNTTGTGLWTLLLIGLDAAGSIQTETVLMNGQTAVNSANTYSAINGMLGLSAGSGNKNAGNIYVGTGTVTAGVPAVHHFTMNAEFNNGMTAIYTVPTGRELILRKATMTLSSANKDVDIYIETSDDGVFWVTVAVFGLEPGGNFPVDITTVPPIAAGKLVRVEAHSNASGTDISVDLSCELHTA